tara:strand:- start:250 stop:762 length:513 start_codon:yes stop_codon:yes gene_type:complete
MVAPNKHFAAVDFRGGAKITIGGATGNSGDVLTTNGAGAMNWTANDSSGGVTKVTFHLKWTTNQGTSFTGCSRGDGASGKFSFESGLDWADYKITLQHDLDTPNVIISIADQNKQIIGALGVDGVTYQYVDMNVDEQVVTKWISDDKTQLMFDPNDAISENANFKITVLG